MTAAGVIQVERIYFTCATCRTGEYLLDQRLGMEGYVSPQARRLLCLAGASWSFAGAAGHLREFCGLSTSERTIREACQAAGHALATWQRTDPAAWQPFRAAEGEIEFSTDGTSVNTWEGWREMKIGIFSKRQRGAAATPEEWDARQLPRPHVRLAFAAIEKSTRFSARWRRWLERLKIKDPAQITVLADGARWIWDRVRVQFPGAQGVLDVYHALEHVASTADRLYGEQTPAARSWTDDGRAALLHGGWPHLKLQIEAAQETAGRAGQKPLHRLADYFQPHKDHLAYRQRLAEGRSIGSGQVEGAAKNLIGRRLKQTGARWRVQRVNRMSSLCCAFYSDHWDLYWKHQNN